MKKTFLLSTAAAVTLLISSPGMSSAASNPNTNTSNFKIDCPTPQEITLNEGQFSPNLQKVMTQMTEGNVNIQDMLNQIAEKYNIDLTEAKKLLNNGNVAVPEQEVAKPKPVEQNTSKPAPQTEVKEPTTEQSSALSKFEQEVVDLTNAERAKNGLSALKIDEELSKVARTKSADMQSNKYFDHNSPTYGSPFDMMKKFGITYKSAGENIAYGQKTPQEVVNAWMNSEGHRKNILNSSFTHIGVGYVEQGNYWTQMFIGK
ncbi:CAP domain-containing protein [Bacillus sp. SM2101]|uniref:CAP domain-containing protein n=1 Tax=Bacillus sp. SM2101 TaxID=2805366 RepID=UPI001BDE3BE6|nr:CAP domain-containing protein [Bacillus sp. SM2101]